MDTVMCASCSRLVPVKTVLQIEQGLVCGTCREERRATLTDQQAVSRRADFSPQDKLR